jgi:hypothetical protein
LIVVVVVVDQDAVTDESANTTLVSIIRRTAVGERPLVLVLIAVNFLPASVRVGIQRIAYLNYGL